MMRYGGSLVGFFSCWCGWEGGAGREFGFVIPGLAAGDGGGVRMDPGVFPFLHDLQGQDGFLWVGVTSTSLFWGWWTSLRAVPHHFYGWCWTQSDSFPLNLSITLFSRNHY